MNGPPPPCGWLPTWPPVDASGDRAGQADDRAAAIVNAKIGAATKTIPTRKDVSNTNLSSGIHNDIGAESRQVIAGIANKKTDTYPLSLDVAVKAF
jgi:hypothetical protein